MRVVPLAGGDSRTHVVSVASGKGGVGKTSMALGLAWALGRAGNRVCLLDADLGLSNVDILLGIEPEYTLDDVLFRELPMEQAIVNVGAGVDLISGASGVPRLAELPHSDRTRLVNEFESLSAYDYLIVDNSPGITAQIMSICLSSRDIVVVANPDATSITDAYALIKVLSQNGLWWSPLVLINRARSKRQARLIFEKIRSTAGERLDLNCGYLGCVLEDKSVSLAAAQRKPLLEAAPGCKAAKGIAAAAASLERFSERRKGRQVSPGHFLDGSIMRIKEQSGGLLAPVPTAPAPRQAPDLSAVSAGLDHIERLVDLLEMPADNGKRRRVVSRIRRELTELRTELAAAPVQSAQPARSKEAASARAEERAAKPVPAGHPPDEAPARREEFIFSEPPAPAASDAVLVVCPRGPMREVLSELLSHAKLTPDFRAPGAGGLDFSGYRMGLICWDGPTREVEAIVADAGPTPIVMLKGYRRKKEPALSSPLLTVVHKPFQVKTLFGAIRRAATQASA